MSDNNIILINNKVYKIERLPIESDEMFYDRVLFISNNNINNNLNDILNESIKYMYKKYYNLKY
jgi:hypothetical protein